MQKTQRKCSVTNHYSENVLYVCIFPKCQNSRFLCSMCVIAAIHNHNQKDLIHIVDKLNYDQSQLQKLKTSKYQINQICDIYDNTIAEFYQMKIGAAAISNNLKYIVSGESCKLNIWDLQTNQLIKQIQFNDVITSCRFSEDTKLLYVGTYEGKLYQFQNQFNKSGFILDSKLLYVRTEGGRLYQFDNSFNEENYIFEFLDNPIQNIYCITTLLLTSSSNFIRLYSSNKKLIFKIKAHKELIKGLDFNKNLNTVVSGSYDSSIKLWNLNDRSLILELNTNNQIHFIQVYFINQNQLLTLDQERNCMFWNINYKMKRLQILMQIKNFGYNISLVEDSQYIITTGDKFIRVYTNDGNFIRQIRHNIDKIDCHNIVQHDSMKAILVMGKYKLVVCMFQLD